MKKHLQNENEQLKNLTSRLPPCAPFSAELLLVRLGNLVETTSQWNIFNCIFLCFFFSCPLTRTSLSVCVSDREHHKDFPSVSGPAISEAASRHHLHGSGAKRLPAGVRGQQCLAGTHKGGVQLLYGLPCATDCRA